jgi:hypothetical protein
MTPSFSKPRVFGVDYQFLSCGDVFTQGLAHAAADLGVPYAHAGWDAPDLQVQIAAFAPDLLFVVHGRKFCARFPNIAGFCVPQTAVWLLDEPYEVDDTATFSPRFDHVFVNDPATLDRHPRSASLPVCYDPHVHRPLVLRDAELVDLGDPRTRAVGFIGGGNPTRDRVLGALAQAGLLSYVVGGAWADPGVNALCLARNINPGATAALYQQTRIVVNIFRQVHHFNARGTAATAMNPRVYEATACGALVVSEWRPEIDEVVPELPTFRFADECVDLVRYLFAHPLDEDDIRQRCAARLRAHTYAARLQTVLTTIGSAVSA